MIVKHIRNGLIEEEHSGYVLSFKDNGFCDNPDYPYYLRSCAKPLQASLIIDYGLDKEFELTSEEIALCCASCAGEKCHREIAMRLVQKFNLDPIMIKCGIHPPLSKTAQALLKNEKPDVFHNNCIGKHLLFLCLTKLNGWDIDTYDSIDHPLQKLVKSKINSLCQTDKDYPVTKDGCGVPIFSMPLKNMLIGYVSLFCDEKYKKIKEAFLNNPYIIGGEDRTDTEIMQNSKGLVSKVGAGGLCVVVNPAKEDALIVKINDCDMKTRRLVLFEALNRLGWSDYKVDKQIRTLSGEVVGSIEIEF